MSRINRILHFMEIIIMYSFLEVDLELVKLMHSKVERIIPQELHGYLYCRYQLYHMYCTANIAYIVIHCSSLYGYNHAKNNDNILFDSSYREWSKMQNITCLFIASLPQAVNVPVANIAGCRKLIIFEYTLCMS